MSQIPPEKPAADEPEKPAASEPEKPAAGEGDPSSWHRLMLMARPRATKANVFAALLTVILGFAMATQVRQNQVLGLESLRQGDLVTILDNATLQSSRLEQSARDLQATRDELVTDSTGGAAALTAAQKRLDALGILAGTARAHGPGIRMTIADPAGKVKAPVLLNAIEELRDAGAEAIQVGGVRVVASSYFLSTGSGIEVDGTSVTPPYTILAIGDPQTMSSAMEIPGGVAETVRGVPATITITQQNELVVGALHTLHEPRYARFVAPPVTAAP